MSIQTQEQIEEHNARPQQEIARFTRDRWETVVSTVLVKLHDSHPATRNLVRALTATRMGSREYSNSLGRERLEQLQDAFGRSIGIGSPEAVRMAIESISSLIEHELQLN